MLSRYTMKRGMPARDLPPGIRQDTRKHTRHPLRPEKEHVEAYLSAPDDAAWDRFRQAYESLLESRFAADRAPFDRIAELAREADVLLGCSCPSAANPLPDRCHTVLALHFMASRYPDLDVRIP